LTADVVDALVAACDKIAFDHSVRAVIVTGAGPAFCAGGSVKDMREKGGLFGGSPAEMRNRYRTGIQRIPLALYELEAPTIAAVNGGAIGAGCDLSLMCDIRIAADNAIFAESFVKLGIIPGDGGAWLLPRAVGMSRACEMSFTGMQVDAAKAVEWGLASRAVPAASLLDEARKLANAIAANPPEVLRMTKRLLREGQRSELRTTLELSAAFQSVAQHLPDHREAVSAMFEKRSGNFTGAR
jgi:enoyl-CoA hydratase/carnithine racemase